MNKWGIIAISIENLTGGIISTNYLVKTSSETLVLRKISRWRKNDHLNQQFLWLLYLEESQENNLKIPYPLLTQDEKFYVDDSSAKYWLYRYIEGNTNEELSLSEAKTITLMISQLHRLTMNFFTEEYSDSLLLTQRTFLQRIEQNRILFENDHEIQEALDEIKDILQKNEIKSLIEVADTLKKYQIHRDIHPNNVLWLNERITGLIDFEHFAPAKYPLIYDLVPLINFLAVRDNLSSEAFKSILTEYQTNALDKDQLNFTVLPVLLILHATEGYLYYLWLLRNNPDAATASGLSKYIVLFSKYFNLISSELFTIHLD